MRDAPQYPGRKAGEFQPSKLNHRALPANGRHGAEVAIAERWQIGASQTCLEEACNDRLTQAMYRAFNNENRADRQSARFGVK